MSPLWAADAAAEDSSWGKTSQERLASLAGDVGNVGDDGIDCSRIRLAAGVCSRLYARLPADHENDVSDLFICNSLYLSTHPLRREPTLSRLSGVESPSNLPTVDENLQVHLPQIPNKGTIGDDGLVQQGLCGG